MTQPPPARPNWCECAPDLVLGASTSAAALGEREPVASVEPEPENDDENGAGLRIPLPPATASASSTLAPLAIAAIAALDSRRYCRRRA